MITINPDGLDNWIEMLDTFPDRAREAMAIAMLTATQAAQKLTQPVPLLKKAVNRHTGGLEISSS